MIYLSAMEEAKYTIAQANATIDSRNRITDELVSCRKGGNFVMTTPDQVDFIDVSPKQLVSVAAALIPFLENDDANRALMGSNMQRQAVPLLRPEAPLVGTGMEDVVARDSGAAIAARRTGVVDQVDATRIVVRATEETDPTKPGVDIYRLRKFQRSNQSTCINQRPLVKVGDQVQKGDIIADGPSTHLGELALGKNVLVAFMPWNGYNFEDSILISERIVRDDVFTSIHIEEFETMARDTKLGPEEITRDIPNVGEESAQEPRRSRHRLYRRRSEGGRHSGRQGDAEGRNPDDAGRKAAARHLRRKGGRRSRHVACACRRASPAPSSKCACSTATASTRTSARMAIETRRGRTSGQGPRRRARDPGAQHLLAPVGDPAAQDRRVAAPRAWPRTPRSRRPCSTRSAAHQWWQIGLRNEKARPRSKACASSTTKSKQRLDKRFADKVDKLRRGDELAPGVMKMVKVFVAVKRKLQPGDKMAGRHGNKGVISPHRADRGHAASGRRHAGRRRAQSAGRAVAA